MTSNPDKHLPNITNSTTNRGVEARETEIANTQLDGDESASSTAAVARPLDCPSYLQVRCGCGGGDGTGATSCAARWPGGTVLLAPCCTAAGDTSHPTLTYYLGDNATHDCSEKQLPANASSSQPPHNKIPDDGDEAEADADCVEVYQFARVGAALCVGSGGRRAQTWRRSANLRKGARTAAAEIGAATRVVLGAPIGGALLALRWTLQLVRDATAGTVHAVSDYMLKPALALLFNALLHPLLVLIANLLQGVSVAMRPACVALGECATHVATVLRAARLVAVENHPPAACRCRCAAPAP